MFFRRLDYYAFGMGMPGRKWSVGNYAYGFNGKENDNEVKGTGNQQDYGFRIYDTRVGRFLSVDPLVSEYPFFSPYHFAGNTPIWAFDIDGREPGFFNSPEYLAEIMESKIRHPNASKLFLMTEAIPNAVFRNPLAEGALKGLVAPLDVFEYTNRNSNQKDPRIRAENNKKVFAALTDVAIGYGASKVIGSTINFFKGLLKEDVKYLFRGTSEGFGGSSANQRLGMTPTSSDPGVATIFAISSKNHGNGVLQIAMPKNFQGVEFTGNVLQSMEKEIALGLKPAEFTSRTSLTITADQASSILNGMGIKIPSKIKLSEISEVIKNTPRLTSSQVDEFYKQAVKIR